MILEKPSSVPPFLLLHWSVWYRSFSFSFELFLDTRQKIYSDGGLLTPYIGEARGPFQVYLFLDLFVKLLPSIGGQGLEK